MAGSGDIEKVGSTDGRGSSHGPANEVAVLPTVAAGMSMPAPEQLTATMTVAEDAQGATKDDDGSSAPATPGEHVAAEKAAALQEPDDYPDGGFRCGCLRIQHRPSH